MFQKKTCVRLSFLLSKTIFFSKITPSRKKYDRSNTRVWGGRRGIMVILYWLQPRAIKYRSVPIHYSSCRPARPLASERYSARPPPTTNNVLCRVTVPTTTTTCTKILTVMRWPVSGDGRTLVSRKIQNFQITREKIDRNRWPDEQVSARFPICHYTRYAIIIGILSYTIRVSRGDGGDREIVAGQIFIRAPDVGEFIDILYKIIPNLRSNESPTRSSLIV